ncbi:MAG: aspartate/glutamate racemase family protein [Oscillospiraceae bacterium]|nr:aspartate/glutamate racemase family protein [Oscillospiraceae bacterium]MCI1990573.1 aspartate/glutamate racemase family protein [Oscillospiraceae bacterium]MCI2036273.1 aspartate/glutamate racemase family protein [Oscillospiraceae bacterium]
MQGTEPYGYFGPGNADRTVTMRKGQNISGYPVGILYIEDIWYPLVPGNIVNGYTFPFPVRLKGVKGLTIQKLFTMDPSVESAVLRAVWELEGEGVRAISGACGFFGNYQKVAAAGSSVPVALSSLIQVPWIFSTLRPDQSLAVLTADASSITPYLLEQCGVRETERLVIRDLRHAPEFSCILEGRGSFDNGKVRKEVVAAALDAVRLRPEIGAILLECSDMPPYAWAVADAVRRPVFDFTTLIRWLYCAVAQTPYRGFV